MARGGWVGGWVGGRCQGREGGVTGASAQHGDAMVCWHAPPQLPSSHAYQQQQHFLSSGPGRGAQHTQAVACCLCTFWRPTVQRHPSCRHDAIQGVCCTPWCPCRRLAAKAEAQGAAGQLHRRTGLARALRAWRRYAWCVRSPPPGGGAEGGWHWVMPTVQMGALSAELLPAPVCCIVLGRCPAALARNMQRKTSGLPQLSGRSLGLPLAPRPVLRACAHRHARMKGVVVAVRRTRLLRAAALGWLAHTRYKLNKEACRRRAVRHRCGLTTCVHQHGVPYMY